MGERREWSVAIRLFVVVAGLLVAGSAAVVAGLIAALSACEGSPRFGDDGVSGAWICEDFPRPVLEALEWVFFATAFLAPLIGAMLAARASRVTWLLAGLGVGAVAVALQLLVNDGQVGVLSLS